MNVINGHERLIFTLVVKLECEHVQAETTYE
jgi:hypothetical protein